MKIAAFILAVLLPAAALFAPAEGQATKKLDQAKEGSATINNLFFAKSGLGIINQNLYIVVKSTENELIVNPDREPWRGKSASLPEIVFFFRGKVFSAQQLPEAFDLSSAVLISFERTKVHFFDFSKMSGGYYERIRD